MLAGCRKDDTSRMSRQQFGPHRHTGTALYRCSPHTPSRVHYKHTRQTPRAGTLCSVAEGKYNAQVSCIVQVYLLIQSVCAFKGPP